MTTAEFLSILHQSRTQVHVWHLQTTSYAEHKALDGYYSSIVGLVDGLTESLQGVKGRVTGYTTKPLADWKEGQSMGYMKALYELVQKERANVGSETWIQNQIDTIAELIAETIYLLSLK